MNKFWNVGFFIYFNVLILITLILSAPCKIYLIYFIQIVNILKHLARFGKNNKLINKNEINCMVNAYF